MKWNTKKIYDEQWPIFYYLLVWYEPSFPTAKEGLDNLENCLRATLSSNASTGQLFFYQKMMPWLRSVSHGYGAFANAILFQLKQGIRFHVMISFQFWLKFSDGLLSFFLSRSLDRASFSFTATFWVYLLPFAFILPTTEIFTIISTKLGRLSQQKSFS